MTEDGKTYGRGSYELYDNQRGLPIFGESKDRASPGLAPGCPGTPQDMQQMMDEMKKELTDRKSRENNLLQIISELRGSQNIVGEAQFVNAEGASGSPSSESLGEKVKDAQIKHLQRQVTILQANLYKSEGWTSRVADAIKEKDKAIDDLRGASAQINQLNEDIAKLREENSKLNASYLEMQQRLRRVVQERDVESRHERCQTQNSKLQEELNMTKAQLETLRESVHRLSQENKSLKEGSSNPQSMSNLACSQELEYLHRVVDTLKNTVMEQRNFLVSMKVPQSNVNSVTSRGDVISNNGSSSNSEIIDPIPALPQAVATGFGSNSGRTPSQQSDLSAAPRIHRVPISVSQSENSAAAMALTGGDNNGLGFEEMAGLVNGLKNAFHNGNEEAEVQAGARKDTEYTVQRVRGLSPGQNIHQSETGQPPFGGRFENKGLVTENRKAPLQSQASAPVRKVSQSEVLARRANSDAQVLRSRTDTMIRRQPDKSGDVGQESKSPAAPSSQWAYTRGQVDMPNLADIPKFQTAIPQQLPVAAGVPGIQFEAAEMSPTIPSAGQFVLGNAAQLPAPARPQNPPTSAAYWQQQQQQQQPARHLFGSPVHQENGSVRVINNDMMGGGRMMHKAESSSPSRTNQASQDSIYVNSSSTAPAWPGARGTNSATAQSAHDEAEMEHHPAQPNADRVCPVCSKNYGLLTMEEFQAHVFECFDDENGPETIKATSDSTGDRQCPMCNTRFGSNVTQMEYEKHVHGHFGEEGPGENFEILQP